MSDRISAALLVIGALFMVLAGLGVLRLPDLFMRLQAATKASTLGVGCLLLGVAVHFQDLTVTARAVLVIAFFFLTAPVGAHMIARAAYAVGVPLWEGTITDELRDQRTAKDLPAPDEPPAAAATPGRPTTDQ
jgi:multicomponent Na+:H+ antiporter subunit G